MPRAGRISIHASSSLWLPTVTNQNADPAPRASRRSENYCQSQSPHVKPRLSFLISAALLAVLFIASGADLPFTFTKVGPESRLTLQPNPDLYFGFQLKDDLLLSWFDTEIEMALGETGYTFRHTPEPGELRGFFRARGISVFSPEDQDGDEMDDLWEIQRSTFNGLPYLDPLDPNDALALSPEPDAGGTNNREYYFFKRGTVRLSVVFTREVSVFNFGTPTAQTEAISRAVSVFNGDFIPTSGIPQVYSREVTTFNFGAPLTTFEAVSREVTAFNFGAPLATDEAISRAVSVFNGDFIPTSGIPQVYSREVTTFNFGAPLATTEAISREVSVFNTYVPPQ